MQHTIEQTNVVVPKSFWSGTAEQVALSLKPAMSTRSHDHIVFLDAIMHQCEGSDLRDQIDWREAHPTAMIEHACKCLSLAFSHLRRFAHVRLCLAFPTAVMLSQRWQTVLRAELSGAGDLGSRLLLEIAEPDAARHFEDLRHFMRSLQPAGVSFMLSEYGHGQLTLQRLSQLFFDLVCIDDAFTARLVDDVDHQFLVEVMIDVARRFDLLIVANESQSVANVSVLRQLGVDCIRTSEVFAIVRDNIRLAPCA